METRWHWANAGRAGLFNLFLLRRTKCDHQGLRPFATHQKALWRTGKIETAALISETEQAVINNTRDFREEL